jgi:hypothetical protein
MQTRNFEYASSASGEMSLGPASLGSAHVARFSLFFYFFQFVSCRSGFNVQVKLLGRQFTQDLITWCIIYDHA